MNRSILVILIGLFAGVASYHGLLALREPAVTDGSIDAELAWMKTELKLSDLQLRQLKSLHEASEPRLRVLASQVARLQQEFAVIENTRRAAGDVDFLKLGSFVETRRNVQAECLASTRQLVLASAEIMTPVQRQRYLGLVSIAVPLNPGSIR